MHQSDRWLAQTVLVSRISRILLFLISISLLLVAIELTKSGATGAAELVERFLGIDGTLNALGFGWFASYLVMSGSPVAAISVAFLAVGALDQLLAYATVWSLMRF